MLRNTIYEDMKTAMKAKESERLAVLRYLWAKIKDAEIDKKAELADEEVQKLLFKELKQRTDAIEQFRLGNREDLAEAEQAQLTIIEAYLPQLMNKAQIGVVVDDVIRSGISDFGAVMGAVMQRVGNQADGKLVSEVVREKLG